MQINRQNFFTKARKTFGGFKQAQVDGINAIFDEWERKNYSDIRWLAYVLATAWHETGTTMQPIEEYGKGKGKPYGQKLKYGQGPDKRVAYTVPDKLFYGRGHTQNTWYEIYEKLTIAAKAAGKNWDFLNHPELLLEMEPSIWATFYAMTTGLYTGKSLKAYFNETTNDAVNARRIINGVDCAILIRQHYDKFMLSLAHI